MESTTGRTIFAAASVLVAIGLVSIASAMAGSAAAAGESAGGLSLYKRELVLALVAFAAFLVVVDLDYRNYERLAPVVYAVAMLLLVLVLVPGIG
ncbi:MAG: FtsW/RodA/SpoVE family cell cycle protein, partial [Planctomycetes bacterium]|nr:FtsW/RodA/SpoVE family cell cycle protein [Planctomycetota bacterium]